MSRFESLNKSYYFTTLSVNNPEVVTSKIMSSYTMCCSSTDRFFFFFTAIQTEFGRGKCIQIHQSRSDKDSFAKQILNQWNINSTTVKINTAYS